MLTAPVYCSCSCCLNLLRQNRGLTPANRFLWLKAILMHDAEVLLPSC